MKPDIKPLSLVRIDDYSGSICIKDNELVRGYGLSCDSYNEATVLSLPHYNLPCARALHLNHLKIHGPMTLSACAPDLAHINDTVVRRNKDNLIFFVNSRYLTKLS